MALSEVESMLIKKISWTWGYLQYSDIEKNKVISSKTLDQKNRNCRFQRSNSLSGI